MRSKGNQNLKSEYWQWERGPGVCLFRWSSELSSCMSQQIILFAKASLKLISFQLWSKRSWVNTYSPISHSHNDPNYHHLFLLRSDRHSGSREHCWWRDGEYRADLNHEKCIWHCVCTGMFYSCLFLVGFMSDKFPNIENGFIKLICLAWPLTPLWRERTILRSLEVSTDTQLLDNSEKQNGLWKINKIISCYDWLGVQTIYLQWHWLNTLF